MTNFNSTKYTRNSLASWKDYPKIVEVRRTSVSKLIIVAIGGALGAVSRYSLGMLVAQFWKDPFPLGTWLINTSGSFAIGLCLTLLKQWKTTSSVWHLAISIGFIGAFTTFSTFEYEIWQLIESGQSGRASFYALASLIIGLLAVFVGVAVGSLLVASD